MNRKMKNKNNIIFIYNTIMNYNFNFNKIEKSHFHLGIMMIINESIIIIMIIISK